MRIQFASQIGKGGEISALVPQMAQEFSVPKENLGAHLAGGLAPGLAHGKIHIWPGVCVLPAVPFMNCVHWREAFENSSDILARTLSKSEYDVMM